nr:right-handed parallel beta-helix repeat-containing protein [uncultured Methanobrevibacter sp.]
MKLKLIFICLLLCVVCSLTAVTAVDSLNDTYEIQSISNETQIKTTFEDDLLETSTFDDLQAQINNAKDKSVITLDKNYSASKDSKIVINKDLTIDGRGHTLDGKNSGYSILYSNKGTVTLKNLIFINGKSIYERIGGAVYLSGSTKVTIINCTFKDNVVDHYGGAIFNGVKENTLSITDSKFINNKANGNYAGAIYSKGAISVKNSYFEGNSAAGGGAICCEVSSDIINSTFKSNVAKNVIFMGHGGAIHAKNDLYVENCTFSNNAASHSGGAIYASNDLIVKRSSFDKNEGSEGGAMYVGGSYTIVDDSIFKNNQAKSGHGGAIYANKWAHIGNSTFIANTADNRGGAVHTDYIQFDGRVSFINNSGKGHGGAIYTKTMAKTASNLYFEGNHADSDYGGAFYINNKCEDVYIYNSEFIGNHAYRGDGGAIYSDSGSTRLHLIGCNFTNNYATGGSEKRYGGAVRSKDTLYIENSIFKGNSAENYGGAVYADLVASITDSYFESNHAKEGGAIYVNNKCTLTIKNSYFKSNYCNERGGAIYTDSKSTSLTITNNAFVSNNAGGQGHDVFNSGNYVSINQNWWGTNNPSFSNKLKEYHTFGSNTDHSDSNPLKLTLTGESKAYVDIIAHLELKFNGDISKYVFNDIQISSGNVGDFQYETANNKGFKFNYRPLDGGNHLISAKLNDQNVTYELHVLKSSVYGVNLVKDYGDEQTFFAIFRDANGNYLDEGSPVVFQVGNDRYIEQVGEDGIAVLSEVINYLPGNYVIKSINKLTGESFTNNLTVLSKNATFNINDVFIMRFSDGDDYVNNQTVTFKIGDKSYLSNVSDGYAFLRLNVTPGTYKVDVLYNDNLINTINITVLNKYSKSIVSLNGTEYGSLIPIYENETFIQSGEIIYSVIDSNTRRYILTSGEGLIVYNVTASNSQELTNVLRKIASVDFKADVIIINLKKGTYKISESFYKDQEWGYLIHLTHGNLFINGNGATIDDEYHHNFMTIESSASATIDSLNFKRFYRCFVNNGNLYCKNAIFEKNDAAFWATKTPGSVIYNKKQATFENCIFDNNDNSRGATVWVYQSNLMAGVLYAEAKSLTNFVKCNFKTLYDTVHACDGSMVVLYDENAGNYNFLTKDSNNNFEQGSCIDYRPASTFNINKTLTHSYDNFHSFLSAYSDEFYKMNGSDFVVNIKKGDYSIKMGDIKTYDFRTFNLDRSTVKLGKYEKGESMWIHHKYLLDVGSRPILINGNGAKLTLTGTSNSADNHFAFVPAYGTLTLVNLTLSGFNTAIVNYGKLILINCTFTNNVIHYIYQSRDSEYGGAIRNYGTVFAYNTTFKDNRATKGAAYYSKGASSFGQFYNCTFEGNTIISNLVWKNGDSNTMFLDDKAIVKIIGCNGVSAFNIQKNHEGLVLFRENLQQNVYNCIVEDMSSLIKLSKVLKDNTEFDIFNVTFINKDFGVFADSKILFKLDYGELLLNGNGARVFVQNQKDNDDTQFLVTTSRSSVVINNLTIQGFNIAIENNGGLFILNSNFVANKVDYAHKKDYGGSIVNQGSVTIYNTTFKDGYAKYGGAIYNKATVVVITGNFQNNKGYNSNSNVDIYNQEASVQIISLGNYPKVVDHFPMAAWKQDLIETGIFVGITAITGGISFGISATGIATAHLINLAVGTVVGGIGGMINGFVYSVDHQDYSTFADRLLSGINQGITAVSVGEIFKGMIVDGKIKPVMQYTKQQRNVKIFDILLNHFLKKNVNLIKEWVSAAVNNKYDKIVWYSFFKNWAK